MMKIVRNPDVNFVAEMRKKLRENGNYCPCSIVRNKDTKCMCKEFREQVDRDEPGFCHCGLYYAVEASENN